MHNKHTSSLRAVVMAALWLAPAALVGMMVMPGCEAVIKTNLVDCPDDPGNPGCAQWGYSTVTSTAASSTGTGDMCGGGARSCTAKADCGISTECILYDCLSGCCSTHFTDDGTALVKGQITGDCQQKVCDGKGATEIATDAKDVPPAKDGCNTGACDGMDAKQAPKAGTCMLSGAPAVCGDPAGAAGGTCVECNVLADCPPGDGCTMNKCLSASCKDGMQDGDETDKDCGGSCLPCALGSVCKVQADCAPGNCKNSLCVAPTCSDGVQDGTESDIDCGASCPMQCGVGQSCGGVTDCQTGPNGAATCNGKCGFNCASGFSDCDASIGCETDITTPAHCGTCNNACSAYCASGTCNDPVKITAGYEHECAIMTNGDVYCWGFNQLGEVGDGTTGNRNAPFKVNLPHGATAIAAGGRYIGGNTYASHTCAILTDQSVYCWGDNVYGELGVGDVLVHALPVKVQGILSVTRIAVGGAHTCAITGNNSLYCWGQNTYGQLGIGSAGASQSTPQQVSLFDTSSASLGDAHTCVIKTDNKVYCWGYNGFGQLGNGGQTAAYTAGVSVGPGAATQVACNGNYTCSLAAGVVNCWGREAGGELGTGVVTQYQLLPQKVPTVTGATELTPAQYSMGALTPAGRYMWGADGNGQLGDMMTTNIQYTVELVPELASFVTIHLSTTSGCGLTAKNQMSCWGTNLYGELGDGTFTDSSTPVPVKWQ